MLADNEDIHIQGVSVGVGDYGQESAVPTGAGLVKCVSISGLG